MFDVYLSEEIEEEEDDYVTVPACTVEKVGDRPGTFHAFNIVKHDICLSSMMLQM